MPHNESDMRIRELQLMAQRYADKGEHEKASQVLGWCCACQTSESENQEPDSLIADAALVEQSERPS